MKNKNNAKDFYDIPDFVDKKALITKEDYENFYVDFSGYRGDFTYKEVFKHLRINPNTFECKKRSEKVTLFLSGHRGSGKTTELNRIASKIIETSEKNGGKNCLYPVVFDIEGALDVNNLDFIDILIYMLEVLVDKLKNDKIDIEENILDSFYRWFSERINEINNNKKSEIKIETGVEGKITIPILSKIFFKLRTSLSGTVETKEIIRTTFTNKFSDFAIKINEFLLEVALKLDKEGKARDLLFIIDGIEKIGTLENRKKVLIEDSNRLKAINANMIISLPIELMQEQAILSQFAEIIPFPVVKIQKRNSSENEYINESIDLFKEFIYRRINKTLFDSENTVEAIIKYSGGAPRELLRIIYQAYIKADDEIIDKNSVEKAVKKLSLEITNYLTEKHFEKLKEIKESLKTGKEVVYSDILQELLEKKAVYEYNSGNYKRVNPVVKISKVYKDNVR